MGPVVGMATTTVSKKASLGEILSPTKVSLSQVCFQPPISIIYFIAFIYLIALNISKKSQKYLVISISLFIHMLHVCYLSSGNDDQIAS